MSWPILGLCDLLGLTRQGRDFLIYHVSNKTYCVQTKQEAAISAHVALLDGRHVVAREREVTHCSFLQFLGQ